MAQNVNDLKPYLRSNRHSPTLLVNQLSQERAANGEKVFGFGFGQSPFPVPGEIRDALASSAHRKEYMSVQGHPPLREAIANFHNQMEGKDWRPAQIIVGAGSKILIFCVLAALRRAHVLLPAPSWVSYEPQAGLAGHTVSWIETTFDDEWRLTPDRLEQFCASITDHDIPLVLVFNYPSNPSGQTYTSEQLEALAVVMRRHNIVVIADEIYSLLSYEPGYATLEQFYPEGCVVTSGLSKWCGAGGWRLGFVRIAEEFGKSFFQAVMGVASETYSCAPTPIQLAATQAYSDCALATEFLKRQTGLLRDVSQYCSGTLQQAGVNVHSAKGGFYLLPVFDRFRRELNANGIESDEQLTAALMADTGVALLPGSAFGMPSKSLTARLAFVDFDGDQILQTERHTAQFDRVKQGIDAMCAWLTELH